MPFDAPSTVAEYLGWDPALIKESLDDSRIAGVEAAIWRETIERFEDLLFQLLPRRPGVMEKGWAPTAAAGAR